MRSNPVNWRFLVLITLVPNIEYWQQSYLKPYNTLTVDLIYTGISCFLIYYLRDAVNNHVNGYFILILFPCSSHSILWLQSCIVLQRWSYTSIQGCPAMATWWLWWEAYQCLTRCVQISWLIVVMGYLHGSFMKFVHKFGDFNVDNQDREP